MATNVNNETGLIGITPKYKFHDQVTIDTGDTIQDVTWLDCEYLAKFKKNSLGPMIVRPDYIYEDTAGSLARNGVTIVGVTTENTLARVTDPEVLRILLANISHTLDNQIRLSEVASGSIGAAWFAGNTKIEVFDCPRGYSVAASAFNGCTGLREVFIQRNVSLGNSAFNGCNRVDCYHFLDTNVGTFGTTVFAGLSGSCYLYVPNEAVVNYCKVANLGSYITRIRGHIKGWHLICADGSYKYNLRDCYDTATNISFRLEGTYVTNLALSVDPETNEATVTVTGMLPDTDENAQLYYEFDYRDHHFSGYVPLHLKTDAAEIIEFEDPEVKRICVANWGGIYRMTLDGYEGELTKEQAAKVSSIGTALAGNSSTTRVYTHLDLSMFTSVTAFNTSHLSYINAPYIILPPNAKSIENYGIAHSRVTYLIITYTAGTFAFNGSWNNSSTISYIYVPDTKVSAYSGRTVYPIIGQEGIIERDREFTLTIPVARYGWNSDLHWSVEENDYISIVSQGDGVATFRATGILPETDTTVTLSYQSNHGNGLFKGTKVLTVKPTPVIEFEDAEVKRICVANWGGGLSVITKVQGVLGELTYAQAAAVTSIGTKFQSNTKIGKFNEFQYFTKLVNFTDTYSNNSPFRGSSLVEIDVRNVNTMCESMFTNCTKLKKLNNIKPTVRLTCTNSGGVGPFYGCSSLETNLYLADATYLASTTVSSTISVSLFRQVGSPEIWIPKSISSISGGYVFYNSTRLTTIVITRETSVVTISNSHTLDGLASGAKVYVPNDLVISYRRASYWANIYTRILPIIDGPSIIYNNGTYSFIPNTPFTGFTNMIWTLEENDYLTLTTEQDGSATIVASGMTSETDTTVSLGYSFEYDGNDVSGTINIPVAYQEVMVFEDAEARRICVNNWGGIYGAASKVSGIPGEITYKQAAAVKSVNNLFKSNTKVISFREYKYFTGVTSATDAFASATNFRNIELPPNRTSLFASEFHSAYCRNFEIPSTVTSIAGNSFHDFYGGGKYVFSEGFTTISSAAFHGCYSNVIMEFPSTLSSIAGGTTLGGSYNRGVIKIVINRDTPPSLGKQDSFNNATHLYIYVPDDYVDTYKSATNWSELAARIHPMSEYTG